MRILVFAVLLLLVLGSVDSKKNRKHRQQVVVNQNQFSGGTFVPNTVSTGGAGVNQISGTNTGVSVVPWTEDQKKQFVDIHNELRDKVAAGQLQGHLPGANIEVVHWDQQLADKAKGWALQLAKSGVTDNMQHNQNVSTTKYPVVGETLYIHGGTIDTGPLIRFALTELFNEHALHTHDVTRSYRSVGSSSFTQIVWHNSNLVGCGIARRSGYMTYYYIVCNYYAPGNQLGKMVYQVGQHCSQCPKPYKCDTRWKHLCLTKPGVQVVVKKQIIILPPTLVIISQAYITLIINKINELRNLIASGAIAPHPQAANMEKVYWDAALSSKAQAWALYLAKSTKVIANPNTTTLSYPLVGEIIYYQSFLEDEGVPFILAFDMMFAEHKKHPVALTRSFQLQQSPHFSQIIWHDSKRIGCGAAKRRQGYITEYFIVCNFVFKGNNPGKPVYLIGQPCSQCPGGHRCDFRYGSLCDTHGKLIFKQLGPFPLPLNGQQQSEVLHAHNLARNKIASGNQPGHPTASNIEVMYWDNELTLHAQNWANKLAHNSVVSSNPIKRTQNYNPIGENIYYYVTSQKNAKPLSEAVQAWYQEVLNHPTPITQNYKDVGTSHLTQVIWHNSKRIGCGASKRVHLDVTYYFLVCNYYKAGNFNSKPVYFVGKPCSACPGNYRCHQKYTALCDTRGKFHIRKTGVTPYVLNKVQVSTILDQHNKFRNQIAAGAIHGQPGASNMEKSYWSKELANKAQAWAISLANREVQESNPVKTSKTYTRVGENIFFIYTASDAKFIPHKSVITWFDQYKKHNPAHTASYAPAGSSRYTQIVWHSARRVGCGAARRIKAVGTAYYFVCNYWQGGNQLKAPVYFKGAACSQCPGSSVCDTTYPSLCNTGGNEIKTPVVVSGTGLGGGFAAGGPVVGGGLVAGGRAVGVFQCPLTNSDKLNLLGDHNAYRNTVALGQQAGQQGAANMRKLVWDARLEQQAMTWALQLAQSQSIKHNPSRKSPNLPQDLGENIYYYSSAQDKGVPVKQSVQYWYKAVASHPQFCTNSFWPVGTETWTQLVWAKSAKIGCGSAKRITLTNYYYYLVCYYDPAGNVPTQPVYQIGTACTACPVGTRCDAQYPGLCA